MTVESALRVGKTSHLINLQNKDLVFRMGTGNGAD
jgi:hypothetical protein